MNLNFHQTFKPEKKHITELLMLANNCVELTKEEISYATGIPQGASSGKVVPHIEYAKFMGLIDYTLNKGKYTIELTPLGELIKDEDISLSEELTLLLLHSMLVRNESGADLWNFVFHIFPQKYSSTCSIEVLKKEVNDYFLTNVNLSPLRSSYDDLFSDLNIINFDDDEITINQSNYNDQFDYLYGYVLYDYWEKLYPNSNEISINELSKLCFRQTFGWSQSEENLVLEKLSNKGIVRLNKQLMPYTILKLNDKNTLLEQIYSELF